MKYMEDGSFQDYKDLYNRKEEYRKCLTCKRYNTSWAWCQSCDPKLLTEGWTSNNETLDELIKSTQLKAIGYGNEYYLLWISYDDLTNIKKVGEGGFATIYKATWLNGHKYVDFKSRINKDMPVALKKLHNSQNISDEFLNEVNYLFFYLFSDFKYLQHRNKVMLQSHFQIALSIDYAHLMCQHQQAS